MSQVSVEHIAIDEKGVARLVGRPTKVSMIVQDVRRGMSPQQIHEAYTDLSLAEIHAALTYYYDNQAQIDQQLRDDEAFVEQFEKDHPDNGLLQRLRAKMTRLYVDGMESERSI